MSGISTRAPYALLKLKDGLDLDTYRTFEEVAQAVVYQHAIACNETAGQLAHSDAQLCDLYLQRLEKIADWCRQCVIESTDPTRLREPEGWPFVMYCGTQVYETLFYAFTDDGWVWIDESGTCSAETATDLKAAMAADDASLLPKDFSTNPEDLGGVRYCILTGRQYIDRLYWLTEHDAHERGLAPYGKWANKPGPVGPVWLNTLLEVLNQAEAAGVTVTVERVVNPLTGVGKTVVAHRPARGYY